MCPGDPLAAPITRDPHLHRWALSPGTLGLVPHDAVHGDVRPPVGLCACCAGNTVPAESAFSPLFCAWCGARVIAFNRSAGRLVVPIAHDAAANASVFPASEEGGDDVARMAPDLARQLDHLDTWRRVRTRALLVRFGLTQGQPVDLTDFLMWSACTQAPALRWEARFVALLDWFAEFLLDTPDTSPALRARIDEAARDYVQGLPAHVLGKLRPAPEHRRAATAGRWARELIDEVLPLPRGIDHDVPSLEARRAPTRRALQVALIRELDRLERRFSRPTPVIPLNITCPQVYFGVFPSAPSHLERPDWLPTKCPRGARLVVALEGLPAPLTAPVTFFRLSLDSRHRFWILWAGWSDPAGFDVTAPAAFGPRGGLADVEAAYLMLEVLLAKLREQGALDVAPRFALTGMLGESLAAHLLRALWGP